MSGKTQQFYLLTEVLGEIPWTEQMIIILIKLEKFMKHCNQGSPFIFTQVNSQMFDFNFCLFEIKLSLW